MRPALAVVIGLLAPAVIAGGCDRCKKQDDVAPPPIAPDTGPPPTPDATTLTIEDAGEDVSDASDADADAAKLGVGKPAASLKACCAALQQNAASAPPPTNMYMMQAAAVCNAAAAQGKDKASAAGMIAGALKGAGMPAACR